MRITVHMVVKNEARWVWFAINSVLNHVDQVIVFDTGSVDESVRIIKSISSDKILFKHFPYSRGADFSARQEQLNMTDEGWVLLLDGDEIWPDSDIARLTHFLRTHHSATDAMVVGVGFYQLVGSIYRRIPDARSGYFLKGVRGWHTIRCFRREIRGLHAAGPFGIEGYFDEEEHPIQEREDVEVLPVRYLHASQLWRSGRKCDDVRDPYRRTKWLSSYGTPMPTSIVYPSCFFSSRPPNVPDPLSKPRMIEVGV